MVRYVLIQYVLSREAEGNGPLKLQQPLIFRKVLIPAG